MKAKVLTAILALTVLFSIARDSYGWGQSPEANLEVFREYTIVGRPVILDGNDPCNPSIDPDGYITKYEWDFEDNSSYDYEETSSSYPDGAFDGRTVHTYAATGTYYPRLRVTDNDSLTDNVNDRAVHVCLDQDADNLPDDWEDIYDLNDANFADADEDADEDGHNNLSEYLHGSVPNDSNSTPSLNITIYVPDDVNSIQRAIYAAIDGDTIVVLEGTYNESVDFNGKSCTLTSADPNDWDIIAATIIYANYADANVVTFQNSEDVNSVLKGFTITGGARGIQCDGTSPTISNCVIRDNSCIGNGGGIHDVNSASPTITNCVLLENSATGSNPDVNGYGGGMSNESSSPTVRNCLFVGNQASYDSGGMDNWSSSPTVINCTFFDNYADAYGGAMSNFNSSDPNVTNCIFWGNDANVSGDEIYNYTGCNPNVTYCDIEGGYDSNNIDSDPCFVNAAEPEGPDDVFGTLDDGLRLRPQGPCIDTGDPNTDPNDAGTVDLAGDSRIVDGDHNDVAVIDMGAYELPRIWFVDGDANGNDDGTSWTDAYEVLQKALADANSGDEIWVAEGTYEPNDGSDRTVSFELVEGASVYGGFAGAEIGRYQRDWILYRTTLSGDIGTVGNQNDNSYHVVKGADNALLDGFTITGGYANGSSPDSAGGGIYCSNTSPTISNCTFSENKAVVGGGMYNYNSSPTLTNCIFSGNSAVGRSSYGGGVYNYDSSPTLTNCIFSENRAGDCGGMYNYDSSPTLTNCIFSENRAIYYGGGMYNGGSSPTLTNCTFSGNYAGFGVGGMYNYNSSPTLTNCIFWADLPDEIYDLSSTPTVTYSNIEGGYSGTGNINSDPCFADVNDAAGPDDVFGTYDDGLRIEANDVNCIDAADGDAAPLQDILGLDRIDMASQDNNGVGDPNYVDMGAYESYYGIDSDGDGIPDDYEKLNGLDPEDDTDAAKDLDGDGLSNETEYGIGTWAFSADTDGDGMDDKWENDYGLDPLEHSADNDADEDTIRDLDEYQDGSNPTVYNAVTVTVYTYTNAGDVNTVTIQDADGNDVAVMEYAYDELGRTWRQRHWANVGGSSNANDIITLYGYDEQGSVVETVKKGPGSIDPNSADEPNDVVTKNTYDSLGRLTDVNDPLGNITSYTYYAGGEPNQVTDPNGNKTTNFYDNAGRLKTVVDEEDHYREYHYDSLGRTIKQIAYDKDDNELMQTRFVYNGAGNTTRRADMAHADSPDVNSIDPNEDMVTDYTYDGNDGDYPGMLVSQTMYYGGDPATSAITYYEYDGLGRRTEVNDPDGNRTLLTYNEAGQVTCREQIDLDPIDDNDLTITTDYYYDSLGRLRHQVALLDVDDDNTWQITTYYYDELGNRIYAYSPAGIWTEYSYNALGQLEKKIADSSGGGKLEQTTEYTYDRLGRQTSIIGYADPNTAQTTQYKYDDLDRITKITYPDTNEITYQYNEAGRVTRRNDQRGIVTTYAYDGVYNMTAKYVDGNSVTDDAEETFTHDGLGRMLTATKDVNGTQISLGEFTYNDIGKITATDVNLFDMGTKTIEYTYDQAGFLTSTRYPYTGTLRADITPDWQGRIDTLQGGPYVNVKYEYIGSRVARRTYDLPKVYDVKSTMEYDNLGRLTNATTIRPFGDLTLTEFDYEYDPNSSNIAEITYVHRDSNTVDYTYDNLDRLTLAQYSIDDSNEIFTIDDLGNRDLVNLRDTNDVDYDIDNLTNRYEKVGDANLTYDAAGNLEIDKDGYTYEYDYENRITKVIKAGPTTVAEFAYDALGRRIKKVDSVAGTTNIYYYNDKWQVLCDYNDSNDLQMWFTYGNYIDEVLTANEGFAGSGYRYYVHDHLYSPVALTRNFGNVEERYEYDAYGNCYILEPNFAPDPDGKSDYGNPYLFTGRRVDILDANSLKIQYNRNRYYDQYTGRWLTHDPLGITPNAQKPNRFTPIGQHKDGTNLYQYIGSNPANRVDSFGLLTDNAPGFDRPPWAAKCGTCGPSVTVALSFFATDLQADYYSWSSKEQDEHCNGMWSLNGWDITSLTDPMTYPGCGTCDCAIKIGLGGFSFQQSVEVYGKCYDSFAVNYYMWGVMNRLCKNSKTEMLVGLLWPKLVSGGYQCKKAWALAGFDLNPAGVSISSCPKYAACKTTCHVEIGSAEPWGYKWKRRKTREVDYGP